MTIPSVSALKVFDAAARLGSFKAAARELAVTPTAVSHQIKALEAQLGIALFIRGTRKVTLTAEGELLLAATDPAFRRINAALEQISGAGQVVTLTTTPAFASLWLIPRIRGFEAAHPGLKINVDTSIHPVDINRDRRFDIAIRYGDGTTEPAELHVPEKLGAYATPAYAEKISSLDTASFVETAWRSGTLRGITWADWFAARGERLPEAADIRRFDEEQHVVSAALAGQGVALVSGLLVADFVERGWLGPVLPHVQVPGLTYSVVVPPDRRPARKVRAFLSWFQREMAVETPG